MEYLASYYTTFRNTHYEKFPLLEYIARKVEVFEYIVRPDLMCACSSYRLPLPDISLILPWQIQIAVILTLGILLIGAAVVMLVKDHAKKEPPLPGAVPELTPHPPAMLIVVS